MVYRLEPQDEGFYEDALNALQFNQAILVSSNDKLVGAEIYKCGVNQRETAIAYFLKYNDLCIGYFIVEPLKLPGLVGLTAIQGWISPNYRGKGLYPELLRTAGSNCSLISDRDGGATESAYNSWLTADGFSHRYYDQVAMGFPNQEMIPEIEKFTANPQGRRWLLVLDPV